jgi:hypothetical protein
MRLDAPFTLCAMARARESCRTGKILGNRCPSLSSAVNDSLMTKVLPKHLVYVRDQSIEPCPENQVACSGVIVMRCLSVQRGVRTLSDITVTVVLDRVGAAAIGVTTIVSTGF